MALAACSGSPDPGRSDGGTGPTGDAGICQPDEVRYQGHCCRPTCEDKQCGDDGCGGSCGGCRSGWTCTAAGRCDCTREPEKAFCQSHDTSCGALTAKDVCGEDWTVDCDLCQAPQTCNAAKGQCECAPELDAAFCARVGKCGAVKDADNCGAERTVECGCAGSAACNLTTQRCDPCTPETAEQFCARMAPTGGKKCGLLSGTNNCGQPVSNVDCGGCEAGSQCDATTRDCTLCPRLGKPEFCSAQNAECGTVTAKGNCALDQTEDCGPCANAGDTCDQNHRCQACVPQSLEAFCAAHGRQCGGPISGLDNCQQQRDDVVCPPCAAGYRCDVAGACQPCTTESETEFCARLGAYCGSVTGTDLCGNPRTAADCGTCTAPATCQPNHGCGDGTTATNDTCAQPEAIALTAAAGGVLTATVHGDTSTATNGIDSLCNTSPTGQDLVYKFTVPPGPNMNLQLAVTPAAGAGFKPNPSVRTTCDDVNTEIACTRTSDVEPVSLAERNLPPGTYFLWMDGYNRSDNGAFDAVLTLTSAPAAPINDNCTSPTVLSFVGDTATETGSLASAVNDYTGSCGTLDGGDVVYQLTLGEASDLVARVAPDAASPALLPAIYLRGDAGCDSAASADEVVCRTASAGVAAFSLRNLAAGTYYLVVDSTEDTFGGFVLTVTATPPALPPANDICAGTVSSVTLDPARLRTWTTPGTTVAASNDSTGSCTAMPGGDVYYAFTLSAAAQFTATVTRDAATPALRPAVYLLDNCPGGTSPTELGCGASSSSATATLAVGNLAAGDYILVVDGANSSDGEFTLTLEIDDPVSNDTCGNPKPLTFTLNAAGELESTVVSDTNFGNGDGDTHCNGGSGKDLVYMYTVPAGGPKAVHVVVTPLAGSDLKPNPEIRTECGNKDSFVACTSQSSVTAAQLAVRRQWPGTYYLWIDGWAPSSNGPFTMTVTLSEPPPAPGNDLCQGGGAEPVSLDPVRTPTTSVTGTTVLGTNDSTGSCGTLNGSDVAYVFTLSNPARVTATVTPDAATPNFKPGVYIVDACPAPGITPDQKACAYTSSTGTSVRAYAANLAVATYYVIVDGYDGTEGNFTLELIADPPMENESCASVQPIVLVGDHALISGDTTGLHDDFHPTTGCTNWGSSPDVVYSLTNTRRKIVTLTLTPTTFTDQSILYVRSDCGTESSEVFCKRAATNTVNSFSVPMEAGVTYYVIVDGYWGSAYGQGAFTLEVQANDPQPPPNDGCARAQALAIDPSGDSTTTVSGTTLDSTSDSSGSCRTGTPDPSGGDVVYSFTLATEKHLTVEVTPTTSTLKPVVFLRQGGSCTAPGLEVACQAVTATSTPNSFTIPFAAPGSYYLWVDSYTLGDNGPFSLTVTTTAIPTTPLEDVCRNAAELTYDAAANRFAAVTGSTLSARDDYTGTCGTTANPHSGGDVAYAFTLPADKVVTVKVTPDGASTLYVPAVYVETVCGSTVPADTRKCGAASSGGSSVTLELGYMLANTTYYLVVDGVSSSRGGYTLDVTTADPIPGDSCLNAKVIDPAAFLVGTPYVDNGDTTNAIDDAGNLACAATNEQTGRDIVYQFSTVGMGTLMFDANLQYSGTNIWPAMSLRTACATTNVADEVACSGRRGGGALALSKMLPEGVYYLWVDVTYSGDKGPYALTLTLTALNPAPSNDQCRGAESLGLLAAGATETRTGSTLWANDDYQAAPSCNGFATSGGDTVYAFSLDAPAMVTAAVRATATASPNYKPAVYVEASTCGTSTAQSLAACDAATSAGGTATAKAYTLPAGAYFIVVDGVGTSGDYTLDVTVGAPVSFPENCLMPTPLTLINGRAVVRTDNTEARDDSAPSTSCSTRGNSGRDLVYVLDTTALGTRDLVASMSFDDPDLWATVYLRSSCTDVGTELGCQSVELPTAGIAVSNLPAGVYYLFIDGSSDYGDYGTFTLTVDALPTLPAVPTNDLCANAQPLVFNQVTGDVTLSSSTAGGTGDAMSEPCVGTTNVLMDGPEVVYTLEVATASSIYATVTRNAVLAPAFTPALALRTSCGPASPPADQLGCATTTTSTSTLRLDVAPGTYYLVVDGSGGSAGRFELYVAVTPHGGNSCANPTALTLTNGVAVVHGDTAQAGLTDAAQGPCNGIPGGNDQLYALTVPGSTAKDLLVEVKPLLNSTFRPVIYLQTTCGTPGNGCAYSSSGATSWRWPRLTGGATYYLWVDSYRASATSTAPTAGPFELKVTLSDPPPPPMNDTCARAQGTPGAAGVTPVILEDAIEIATDGTSPTVGACGSTTFSTALAGPDRVYPVLGNGGKITAKLAPSSSWSGTVYIRQACEALTPADQVACATSAVAGTAVTAATATNTTAGSTYYVWVDSTDPVAWGSYRLDIAVGGLPSNDKCAGAYPLTKGVPVDGDTTDATDAFNGTRCTYSGGNGGRDVVFSYTPAASGNFTAAAYKLGTTEVLRGGAGWDGVIWITTSCATETDAMSKCVKYADDPESVTFAGVANQTYYIILEGYGSSHSGPFTVVVQ